MDITVTAILNEIEKLKKQYSPFMYASFVATAVADADLSTIDTGLVNEITGTSYIDFIPKARSVGVMTFGDRILVTKDPMVILCIVDGNVDLAEFD